MSGSISPPGDVRLRVRYGPPQRRIVGSTVALYVDALDASGAAAPVTDAVLSGVYRRPAQADFPTRDVPLIPFVLGPGQWRVDVPAEMPGTYRIWLVLVGAGWITQLAHGQFDAGGGA